MRKRIVIEVVQYVLILMFMVGLMALAYAAGLRAGWCG